MEIIRTFFFWLIFPFTFGNEPKIDCYPDGVSTREVCERRSCKWNCTEPEQKRRFNSTPSCFFPLNDTHSGYDLADDSTKPEVRKCPGSSDRFWCISGKLVKKSKKATGPVSKTCFSKSSAENVLFTIVVNEATELEKSCVDVEFGNNPRKCPTSTTNPPNCSAFYITYSSNNETGFSFSVIAAFQDSRTVFNTTAIPGLFFGEHFAQMTSRIGDYEVYGIGEVTRTTLRADGGWRNYGLWVAGNVPFPNFRDGQNLGGFYPVYKLYNKLYDRMVDVTLTSLSESAVGYALQPGFITLRTITGKIVLKIRAAQVGKIDTELYEIPYWALGYHLSRSGYKNLEQARKVYNRNHAANISFSAFHLDIDFYENLKTMTIDPIRFKNLPGFAKKIHADGRKLVLTWSIPMTRDRYENFSSSFTWLKGKTGDFVGSLWGREVYYIDPFNSNSSSIVGFLQSIYEQTHFDGLILSFSEPANFQVSNCSTSHLNKPPYNPLLYAPDGSLSGGTVCNDAKSTNIDIDNEMFHRHNLYAHALNRIVHSALKDLMSTPTPFVLAGADCLGLSKPPIFSQDGGTFSSFNGLRYSVVRLLQSMLIGKILTGSEVCGFNNNANRELCIRWHQLAAFFPFARNHNSMLSTDQDPAYFSPETTKLIQDAIRLRHRMMPLLYTALVMKDYPAEAFAVLPVKFYAKNLDTDIDNEFIFGPRTSPILVAPVVSPLETKKEVYFPAGLWYGADFNKSFPEGGGRKNITMKIDTIPHYYSGGTNSSGMIYFLGAHANVPRTTFPVPHRLLVLYNEGNKATGFGAAPFDDIANCSLCMCFAASELALGGSSALVISIYTSAHRGNCTGGHVTANITEICLNREITGGPTIHIKDEKNKCSSSDTKTAKSFLKGVTCLVLENPLPLFYAMGKADALPEQIYRLAIGGHTCAQSVNDSCSTTSGVDYCK